MVARAGESILDGRGGVPEWVAQGAYGFCPLKNAYLLVIPKSASTKQTASFECAAYISEN